MALVAERPLYTAFEFETTKQLTIKSTSTINLLECGILPGIPLFVRDRR
jgi:hypothetical protein